MKFIVMFKTTDAMYYAKRNAHPENHYEMEKCASKFIMYGEQLTVEMDTETGTATVIQVGPA